MSSQGSLHSEENQTYDDDHECDNDDDDYDHNDSDDFMLLIRMGVIYDNDDFAPWSVK